MAAPDRRVVAAVVALVLGATAIVAGVVVGRRDRLPGAGLSDTVPPIPSVRSVAELGPLTEHARVGARDNGQSTRYGDRSIWVFGDTVLRRPEGFLSNSGASTTDLRAADGIRLPATDVFGSDASSPAAMVTHTPAEGAFERRHAASTGCTAATDPYCGATFAFWPGPVIADPRRARVLAFYVKLCRGGAEGTPCSGPYGRPLGTGVAALDMRTHRVTRLTAANADPVGSIEGADPTLFFPPSDGYHAAALVVGADAYVYGACTDRCHLARVPLNRISDRSRWTFYGGREADGDARWSPEPAAAVDTVLAGSAGNTIFRSPALGGWLNVYLPAGDDTIRAQIGGSPFGPWSAEFRLLTTRGSDVAYAGFGHPEYAEDGGRTQYLTYYRTDTENLRLVKVTFGG